MPLAAGGNWITDERDCPGENVKALNKQKSPGTRMEFLLTRRREMDATVRMWRHARPAMECQSFLRLEGA